MTAGVSDVVETVIEYGPAAAGFVTFSNVSPQLGAGGHDAAEVQVALDHELRSGSKQEPTSMPVATLCTMPPPQFVNVGAGGEAERQRAVGVVRRARRSPEVVGRTT